ncbi:helix-turn-helix domain-containing protein [Lichenifustis flavocetrariae]|uniref:Helix-turn-helix domain-containing protein n=1 Tax=Lichenifustis flavocetrariae TaxID=2949735 RepID=A0AA41YXH9_9HYPH|nr:helix-turn-helix transcriptional regulator [Lichenifustis flavocetrariae]MCW6506655.1 helix-turn-helix domain-containing protein [Lichenifustis flavocetrariae]
MNAIHINATIDGDTVTTPRAEFDRIVELLEDAQDAAAADNISRKLLSGEEELLPAAFVDRALADESLVRLWREHRHLTEEMLAGQADIPVQTLYEIEQGTRESSVAVLKAIAVALQVGLDDLV